MHSSRKIIKLVDTMGRRKINKVFTRKLADWVKKLRQFERLVIIIGMCKNANRKRDKNGLHVALSL